MGMKIVINQMEHGPQHGRFKWSVESEMGMFCFSKMTYPSKRSAQRAAKKELVALAASIVGHYGVHIE